MVFWDVKLCSLVDRYECFTGYCYLHLQSRSSLKMETTGFSEMLVPIYQTTRCHITEDHNLNIHCHEKLTRSQCININMPYVTGLILSHFSGHSVCWFIITLHQCKDILAKHCFSTQTYLYCEMFNY
jgi:hypothetical protein